MHKLTARQQEVLDWITGFIDEHGMPRTVLEVGAQFGIASTSVFDHLKALERTAGRPAPILSCPP